MEFSLPGVGSRRTCSSRPSLSIPARKPRFVSLRLFATPAPEFRHGSLLCWPGISCESCSRSNWMVSSRERSVFCGHTSTRSAQEEKIRTDEAPGELTLLLLRSFTQFFVIVARYQHHCFHICGTDHLGPVEDNLPGIAAWFGKYHRW